LKLIKKTDTPLKPIMIDSSIVFISVIVGLLITEQFGFLKSIISNPMDDVKAFISNPEF
jgi:hypothetical protein